MKENSQIKYRPEGSLIGTYENRSMTATQTGLEHAMAYGEIVEGMAVMCDREMNITVDLGGPIRGVIARDEIAYASDGAPIKDIAVITRVGRAVCFKVIGFSRDAGGTLYAVLSRRQAQLECVHEYLMHLTPGDIIDAKVTHMEQFGAFLDIGCGVVSLISIDCISVSRIAHPHDRFYVGQRLRAVVRTIDYATNKIYLSYKELLGTWMENASLFSVGQTVAGVVRSIEDYGIFVELTPNLAGLAEPRGDIIVGQTAAVYIKNMIPDRMKIKLILIDSYKGELTPDRHRCFISPEESHIDYWRYSPRGCSKVIETNFMELSKAHEVAELT